MHRLKKFFITTKQTLIKDVTKEWNMEWLAEKIKISVRIRSFSEYGDTKYLSVFSPNAGKYGPGKLRIIWTLFRQW